MPQSPDNGQNSDKGISDFRISGQSLIKGNCHNSRISDDIDDDVISENCDVIAIFPSYGQFRANRKPDSGRIVCTAYIFINSNLLSYKN